MHYYDVVGYTLDADTYCVACTPLAAIEDESAYPIFVGSEWDYYPTCGKCGGLIDEVSLTSDGMFYQWQIDHNARDVTREEYDRLTSEGSTEPYDITDIEVVGMVPMSTPWGERNVFLTDDSAYDHGAFVWVGQIGQWYTIPGFIKDGTFHPDTSYLQELPPELYQ